jgi:hypothetical protein
MFQKLSSEIVPYSLFGDTRLSKRFGTIVKTLGEHISMSLSLCHSSRSEQAGFYRFMNNDNVNHERIVLAERDRVSSWVKTCSESVILSFQDTTEVNYTGRPVSDALGCLSQVYQKGYFVHTQLISNAQGLVQGVFGQTIWNRAAETLGRVNAKTTKRSEKPFEERESYRWLESFAQLNKDFADLKEKTIIHIGDRESDIYELMAVPRQAHIHYLFRAKFNRKINTDKDKLFDAISQSPLQGEVVVEVPCTDNPHIKRKARLEIRFSAYSFTATPYNSPNYPKQVTSNLIELKEVNPPSNSPPIHWHLMTSLDIQTFEEAIQVCQYYLLRWRIEEFHVVLKQGCAIEKLNFETPKAIENLIITFSIIAATVLNMRYCFDVYPHESVEIIGFSAKEYNVLAKYISYKTKKEIKQCEQPTVADFTLLIQMLGSGNKYPKTVGIRALWIGLKEAATILDAFRAFQKE